MAKKILGDFLLPDEGDIIDQVAGQQEARQLKARADFLGLLAGWGLEVKKNGRGHMIRCPFHEDTTPSCSVEPEKKLFHCFGCGQKGDIIDFVRAYRGTDFSGALEVLRQSTGAVVQPTRVSPSAGLPSSVPINRPVAKKRITDLLEVDTAAGIPLQSLTGTTSQLPVEPIQLPATEQSQLPELKPRQLQTAKHVSSEPAGTTKPLQTIEPLQLPGDKPLPKATAGNPAERRLPADPLTTEAPILDLDTIAGYYHQQLFKSRKALGYLETRGLTDRSLLSRYRVGYCDGSLKEKLSASQEQELQALGVLRKNGREHFAGYLTFPLCDEDGRTLNFYGRSVSPASQVPHLYLPGSMKGIFNPKACKVYDEIILTESVIDALSLLAAGLQNVQPIYGTNGFTPEHRGHLKSLRVKTVVLALDNDESGHKAAETLAAELLREGIGVMQIFPESKDWNEELSSCSQEPGKLADKMKARLAAATRQEPAPRSGKLKVIKQGQKYQFDTVSVTYRLLGVKQSFVAALRVNIRAEKDGKRFLDNTDLNSARSRSSLAQQLSRLFDLPEQQIENDLLGIVDWLEAERDRELAQEDPAPRELTAEEKKLGMELLTSPELMQRIISDLEVLGYVGEDLNKQLIYLAASSRKLPDPISVMILSQSASGKSLLVETVRKLIPPEDVVAVSSLSDQALNYMSEGGLLQKFLILGEAVHSDVVELQIREMLSNHELSRMVTCKNEKTTKMETSIIKTKVIVSAMLSSTRFDVNPENASRCFLINTDESSSQTRNIHQAQKRKYSISRYCEKTNDIPAIIAQHHAAQRLLKPRVIFNPLADYLDFPDSLMRTRRDHERFIDLIASVCFLRQYQKTEKKAADPVTGKPIAYIECDLEDYAIAYEIMTKSVLGATYSELPKSMIAFYEKLREVFRSKGEAAGLKPVEVQLTQREIRKEVAECGQETIKYYLRKLAAFEYLLAGSRGRGSRSSYQLIADEPIERLDCSMIPAPEEIREKVGKPEKK